MIEGTSETDQLVAAVCEVLQGSSTRGFERSHFLFYSITTGGLAPQFVEKLAAPVQKTLRLLLNESLAASPAFPHLAELLAALHRRVGVVDAYAVYFNSRYALPTGSPSASQVILRELFSVFSEPSVFDPLRSALLEEARTHPAVALQLFEHFLALRCLTDPQANQILLSKLAGSVIAELSLSSFEGPQNFRTFEDFLLVREKLTKLICFSSAEIQQTFSINFSETWQTLLQKQASNKSINPLEALKILHSIGATSKNFEGELCLKLLTDALSSANTRREFREVLSTALDMKALDLIKLLFKNPEKSIQLIKFFHLREPKEELWIELLRKIFPLVEDAFYFLQNYLRLMIVRVTHEPLSLSLELQAFNSIFKVFLKCQESLEIEDQFLLVGSVVLVSQDLHRLACDSKLCSLRPQTFTPWHAQLPKLHKRVISHAPCLEFCTIEIEKKNEVVVPLPYVILLEELQTNPAACKTSLQQVMRDIGDSSQTCFETLQDLGILVSDMDSLQINAYALRRKSLDLFFSKAASLGTFPPKEVSRSKHQLSAQLLSCVKSTPKRLDAIRKELSLSAQEQKLLSFVLETLLEANLIRRDKYIFDKFHSTC